MWRWLRVLSPCPVGDPCLDALIKPPRPLHDGHDESLPKLANARRAHVEAKQREAARILTGEQPESRLIVVDREMWR